MERFLKCLLPSYVRIAKVAEKPTTETRRHGEEPFAADFAQTAADGDREIHRGDAEALRKPSKRRGREGAEERSINKTFSPLAQR
jgi:hypothetical protein